MTAFYLLPGSDGSTRIWASILSLLATCGDIGIPVGLASTEEPRVRPGLRSQVERVEAAIRCGHENGVLVGYSYSGLVASAVVRRGVARVARAIYVDAIVPEIASCGQELLERVPRTVRHLLGDDATLLYPPVSRHSVPLTYVHCTARPRKALYSAIDPSAASARALGWEYSEVATGHRPMLEAPSELLLRLRALPRGRSLA
jgi:pimeloyl-ACP methyl ester carboxylesterase